MIVEAIKKCATCSTKKFDKIALKTAEATRWLRNKGNETYIFAFVIIFIVLFLFFVITLFLRLTLALKTQS